MSKDNNTIVCNVIAFEEKEKENNRGGTEVVNSGAYELGELGVTIDASAGKVDINPDKGTITYIVNGTKKTLKPTSEEFRNAVKSRKEKISKKEGYDIDM